MALKTNSKRILDIIATQPAVNGTQAYKKIHTKASDLTARNNVSQLLKKPEAQIYLQSHIDNAVKNIVELGNSAKNENVRLSANQDILDRTKGKARQITEVTTTGVTLNIDLTTSLLDD